MFNRFVFVLNRIISLMIRFFRKIRANWTSLRKVFVVIVFVFSFMFYLQSPDIKLKLGKTAQLTILQYEKNADNYVSLNQFENAIDEYKFAVSIILSQKNIDDISIDKNVQCRVCKKSANAFIKYCYNNELDQSHKKTGHIFLDALNLQKEYFEDDSSLDYLIKKINKAITK